MRSCRPRQSQTAPQPSLIIIPRSQTALRGPVPRSAPQPITNTPRDHPGGCASTRCMRLKRRSPVPATWLLAALLWLAAAVAAAALQYDGLASDNGTWPPAPPAEGIIDYEAEYAALEQKIAGLDAIAALKEVEAFSYDLFRRHPAFAEGGCWFGHAAEGACRAVGQLLAWHA